MDLARGLAGYHSGFTECNKLVEGYAVSLNDGSGACAAKPTWLECI